MLKHILGNLPVIRILDFLIDNPNHDYTRAEIAHYAQVGPTAMKDGFKCLEQCGIVIETRKIGGVPLYTLDRENEMTQSLIEFDEALTAYYTDKILETEAALDREFGEPLPDPPED
jgi:DNA-binding transcriptional ArsR family regulator